MMRSIFMTLLAAQTYFRYNMVATMLLKHADILARVKTINGGDGELKSMSITHLDYIKFYATNMEDLTIMISSTNTFVENPPNAAPCHVITFYNSAKRFLEEQKAVFVDHHIDCSGEIELLNTPMSQTRTKSITVLKIFFIFTRQHIKDQEERKEPRMLGLKIYRVESAESCRSFSQTLILQSWRRR